MGFRTFHLQHHRYQGEFSRDADLAGPLEAKWVGGSPLRKTLWLFVFFFIEGVVRPARVKEQIKLWDRWVVINLITELSFLAAFTYFAGLGALEYLALSTFFCVGLHPVGARWIQEHYLVKPGQETYSYYGPMNRFCFNVGFHNEHHDMMMVPWSKLPLLKKMAPGFYEPLHSHRSWTKLLFQFIFTPELNLYSRAVRPSRAETLAQNDAEKVPFLMPTKQVS
jgi:sphingolipid delta-4 desaturase